MEKKKKLPHKYKRFNKMSFIELGNYIWETYNYKLYKDEQYYTVYNYYGKCIIKADSPDMLVYWLDFIKSR